MNKGLEEKPRTKKLKKMLKKISKKRPQKGALPKRKKKTFTKFEAKPNFLIASKFFESQNVCRDFCLIKSNSTKVVVLGTSTNTQCVLLRVFVCFSRTQEDKTTEKMRLLLNKHYFVKPT